MIYGLTRLALGARSAGKATKLLPSPVAAFINR
jgi:hypothetical protein